MTGSLVNRLALSCSLVLKGSSLELEELQKSIGPPIPGPPVGLLGGKTADSAELVELRQLEMIAMIATILYLCMRSLESDSRLAVYLAVGIR